MTLTDITSKLKEKYGLSEEQVAESSAKIAILSSLTLLKMTDQKLSETDKSEAQALAKNGGLDKLLPFLQSKFSPGDWQRMNDQAAETVLESFQKEVLKV